MSYYRGRVRVLVTHPLPPGPVERLAARVEVTLARQPQGLSTAQLIRRARGAHAVLCMLTNRIDAAVMDALPSVKLYANYAVGYDNIDVPAATERSILVTNTPGVLTETTADLTWALILSVARRIPESDRFLRHGHWNRWEPTLLLGTDVHGKTLGIVGFGCIGRAVAMRAKGFGIRVLCANRSRISAGVLKRHRTEQVGLRRLLRSSDFVSIHAALNKSTVHLIGAEELRIMRPGAFLINTARGPIVDEEALVAALHAGEIAGAGLDVYENEPRVHSGLTDMANVTLLPHLGSATLETRTKMADLAVRNIEAFAAGKKPPHCVNPDVWRRR